MCDSTLPAHSWSLPTGRYVAGIDVAPHPQTRRSNRGCGEDAFSWPRTRRDTTFHRDRRALDKPCAQWAAAEVVVKASPLSTDAAVTEYGSVRIHDIASRPMKLAPLSRR
jgi:hypothetical protein